MAAAPPRTRLGVIVEEADIVMPASEERGPDSVRFGADRGNEERAIPPPRIHLL